MRVLDRALDYRVTPLPMSFECSLAATGHQYQMQPMKQVM